MSVSAIERGIGRVQESIRGIRIPAPSLRGVISNPVNYVKLSLAAMAGLAMVACARQEINPATVTQEPNKAAAAATLAPGVGGEPIATFVPTSPHAEVNKLIDRFNKGEQLTSDELNRVNTAKAQEAKSNATSEAQKPIQETEQPAQCSFFKDPKYCNLVEVFETTTPTGASKAIGIKSPSDPSTVIEIVSSIDGWIQPILNNSYRANISTDKNKVVEGWVISGVEFNPTGSAEATPVKKGQVIGTLKNTGQRPLSYAPEYIAYFGPRSSNVEAHIVDNFPSTAGKPVRKVEFKSSDTGTRIEQGPVILGSG